MKKEITIKKLAQMNYDELCDYLKAKYGKVPNDYMTANWNKIQTITRTNDGLYLHHIDEDKAIMLSTKTFAMKMPFAFQKADRLVYCNLLEHLLLHIKIMEYPKPINENTAVGFGGIFNFILPELNDIFSEIKYKLPWKENIRKKIINLEKEYLFLVEYIIKFFIDTNYFLLYKMYGKDGNNKLMSLLLRSFNEKYGWDANKNVVIYNKIKTILKELLE